MIDQPAIVQELRARMANANARGEKLPAMDLVALNRILAHSAEDMTVTVQAGISLRTLQEHLVQRNQWLPIDPPKAEQTTIDEILNLNLSGPRRFGCGPIRDHLIGIKVVLADGRLIKSGGNVVKNVAGYDLQKLFIGSRGSLGVIIEATFKLRPLPESEEFIQLHSESLQRVGELIEMVLASETTPVVFDLHRATPKSRFFLVLGFAGTREEVDWQLAKARELGFTEPATLEYDQRFWAEATPTHRYSVLPSRLLQTIRSLGEVSFVARAGNGIVCYRGGTPPPKTGLPLELMRRIKQTYDPKQILPDLPT